MTLAVLATEEEQCEVPLPSLMLSHDSDTWSAQCIISRLRRTTQRSWSSAGPWRILHIHTYTIDSRVHDWPCATMVPPGALSVGLLLGTADIQLGEPEGDLEPEIDPVADLEIFVAKLASGDVLSAMDPQLQALAAEIEHFQAASKSNGDDGWIERLATSIANTPEDRHANGRTMP